jgi:general secretion pathway protein H
MPRAARERRRNRRRERGFSLIEMIIAVALLATLTGLAAVSFAPASDRLRLRAEAREIVDLLHGQRTVAITSGRPTTVLLDPAESRLFYGDPALVRLLPPTLRMAATEDLRRIVFYPEGGASGGHVVIHDQHRRLDITIDWLTGRITLSAEARHDG